MYPGHEAMIADHLKRTAPKPVEPPALKKLIELEDIYRTVGNKERSLAKRAAILIEHGEDKASVVAQFVQLAKWIEKDNGENPYATRKVGKFSGDFTAYLDSILEDRGVVDTTRRSFTYSLSNIN